MFAEISSVEDIIESVNVKFIDLSKAVSLEFGGREMECSIWEIYT